MRTAVDKHIANSALKSNGKCRTPDPLKPGQKTTGDIPLWFVYVIVAQLVEHLTFNQRVFVGSSPIDHTSYWREVYHMAIANGYILVWCPNHLHANTSGMVYEHVLVAEQKIGRPLKREEVVHHINHIRNDNRPENLIVFATQSDHTRFHMLHEDFGMCHQYEDGSYWCEEKINRCQVCGVIIDRKTKLCVSCHKNKLHSCWPTRENLKKLIRDTPFDQIGRMFNVTGNSVKKW